MWSQRSIVVVTVFLSLLCIASGASVGGTPTPSGTPTQDGTATHTLVITAQNGAGSYTITAANKLQLTHGEQGDYQLRGPRVSGTVGGSDKKDVIRYTGYIESFQADGSVRVTLDGRQIAPAILGGQHIRITRSAKPSDPIRYQFGVTGQLSRGDLAEQNDTVAKSHSRGRVQDRADSFYFTGTITNDSIMVSGPVQIQINGQPASVFLTHEPPTPTPTPPPATPTAAVTPSPSPSGGSPDARQSPRPTGPSPPPSAAPRSPSGLFGSGFVAGLVGGLLVIGMGVIVVVMRR